VEGLEIRDMKPEDELYVGSCGHLNDPGYDPKMAKYRAEWLRNAYSEKDLRIKVALLSGKPVGFIHIYPIETSPCGPLGKDLSVVWCVLVPSESRKNGIGSALIKAAEEEARYQGRKGIVAKAYYIDRYAIPALFVEKCGYARVRGPRQMPIKGMRDYLKDEALLWKVFEGSPEPPQFLERNYKYKPVPGKVVVDLFHSASCLTGFAEREHVREVCRDFGDRIIFNQYNADNPEILGKYQIYRGIFINGREIGWGYEAPKEGVYQAIEKAL